ncbi:Rad52/Rad22 family DNA repair protein [Clostridium sp. UBA3887]|uniref:Rad52/Rad22 family DNA repair protein n=1 Tax=Clostridium sp. UBA3887 TaxID=1946356 RepID=UPI003216A901
MDIQEELRKPFGENEVEWRVQSCGVSNNKPWAMVLCYVQARAIQNRLDYVFGFDGWKVEYRTGSNDSNIICRISVKDSQGEWIYKEDGASESNVEPFKGGISGALKRCASSGYGIGRYLYNLTESFAECSLEKPKDNTGWKKAVTKDKKTIYWKIPKLPTWALPSSISDREIKELTKLASTAGISEDVIKQVIEKDFGVKEIKELSSDQYEQVYMRLSKKCDPTNKK